MLWNFRELLSKIFGRRCEPFQAEDVSWNAGKRFRFYQSVSALFVEQMETGLVPKE